jgi:hypothetical protein
LAGIYAVLPIADINSVSQLFWSAPQRVCWKTFFRHFFSKSKNVLRKNLLDLRKKVLSLFLFFILAMKIEKK